MAGKTDARQRELTKLREAGTIRHGAAFTDGTTVRFHVVLENGTRKEFTGTQVDAFLFGVRVGQSST